MNACEFCRMMWIAVITIGAFWGFFHFLQWVENVGRDAPCIEAAVYKVHLNDCDKSDYPYKPTPDKE